MTFSKSRFPKFNFAPLFLIIFLIMPYEKYNILTGKKIQDILGNEYSYYYIILLAFFFKFLKQKYLISFKMEGWGIYKERMGVLDTDSSSIENSF